MKPNPRLADAKILAAIEATEGKVGIGLRPLAARLKVPHPSLLYRLRQMAREGTVVELEAGGYAVTHRKHNGKSIS